MKKYKSIFREGTTKENIEIAIKIYKEIQNSTKKEQQIFKKQMEKKVSEIYKKYKKEYKTEFEGIKGEINQEAFESVESLDHDKGNIVDKIILEKY